MLLYLIACFSGAYFYLSGEEYAEALPGMLGSKIHDLHLPFAIIFQNWSHAHCNVTFIIYLQNGWGWNEAEKRKELFEEDARYLLVMQRSKLVAFVHFRFLVDDDGKRMLRFDLFIVH